MGERQAFLLQQKKLLILLSEFAASFQGGRMLNNASQGAQNNDHLRAEIAR